MNLETLATAVKSNFKTLQEGEIIGRIMIISGRNFTRSVQGYKLLCENKMLPEGFIQFPGVWLRLIDRNPALAYLMDRLDGIPGKMHELEFQGFIAPPMLTREEAKKLLNLPELPDLDF